MNPVFLKISRGLRLILLCGLAAGSLQAYAQDEAPMLTEAASFAPAMTPVVVELFSSQACPFCPAADKLFAGVVAQNAQIIGLACHIDYFDVQTNSLSKPFCTKRQNWYARVKAVGTNYTPQMVVQGQMDVVGYREEDVGPALERATTVPVAPLSIAPGERNGHFIVSAPAQVMVSADDIETTLMLYDKPHDITIAEGRNQGTAASYVNIVSALEETDGWEGQLLEVTPNVKDLHKGFAVLVQDKKTGHILAAGRYEF